MKGTIQRLNRDKGFGFIKDPQGQDYFFHRTDLRGATFESVTEGDDVEFDGGQSPKGPRASNVRVE